MKTPTFGTLDRIHEWFDTSEAVKAGLLAGYIRRAASDHGVSLDRMCVGEGAGLRTLSVDGVEVARIELVWSGYVGSWRHSWTGDWLPLALLEQPAHLRR